MENIQAYFDSCVQYWMETHHLNKDAAIARAIWWDCVEIWNADGSWNNDKIAFINKYRSYRPYDPIPEEKCVADGNA